MALNKNYINGEWVEGKGVRENINPSDLSDIVGEYAQADRAQAETAIAAARAAFPTWQATSPQQRADILETVGAELLARKDEIGRLLAREEGKPLANGIAETMRAAQIFKIGRHKLLPLAIDLFLAHSGKRGLETPRRFKVTEQQAIVAHKERIIVPSGSAQRIKHFRPNFFVMRCVLLEFVLANFE